MEINLTLCNFSKLINFITSIDGDLNGASIEYIVEISECTVGKKQINTRSKLC